MTEKKMYRITVLTSRLIRLEYDPDGVFEDRRTQTVINREFSPVEYQTIEDENGIQIITEKLHLTYDEAPFSPEGLVIRLRDRVFKMGSTWHYGENPANLGGTVRTLDQADGSVPLEYGLMSKIGVSWMDDSASLILKDDGSVIARKSGQVDGYFWGYGKDYKACLKDFYHLCGNQPLLPKYTLGNWWSRYYKYTDQEYLELMERYRREEVPFTVAVLDMDWHYVDIDPKYGSGWTGYTWNRKLFPDPKKFLDMLHEQGLAVTLNVHPADGVMPFEDAYRPMLAALGLEDTDTGIPFKIEDPAFREAYFRYLHHPLEEEGVDFWWIDWQQGAKTGVKGMDPLWMLNHFHFEDQLRQEKRPLILSRYAGPGSHRYPLGFSGDTIVSWESLAFQPYFTVTASNIGYGWWSNDIGGHMYGKKDDELALRWLQFGVFSPINRLHSSDNPFDGKEPWRYNEVTHRIMNRFLRLRHRMIPYLYSMNYLCALQGKTLLSPMYYENPEEEAAYTVKNQYYFGTGLIVSPVTSPMEQRLRLAKTKIWLPEGIWFDFFTRRIYEGGRELFVYRDLESIPVFAKAGSILPMYPESYGNGLGNPEEIELHLFGGADGVFELYEDDEKDPDGGFAVTVFSLDWKERRLTIHPAKGNTGVLPEKRIYRIYRIGFGKEQEEPLSLAVDTESGAIVEFEKSELLWEVPAGDFLKEFLNRLQLDFKAKEKILHIISSDDCPEKMLGQLYAMELPPMLYGYLLEILTGRTDRL